MRTDRLRPMALVLLCGLALAAGCSGAPTVGAVTVADLRAQEPFYQGAYLGRTVTVTDAVVDVPFPQELELASPDGRPLRVLTRAAVTARAGDRVRVTGTVGQLQSTQSADRVPYVQDHLYREATAEAYLYNATVG